MKKIIMPVLIMMLSSWTICAQNTLRILVKSHEGEAFPGATITLNGTAIGTNTNEDVVARHESDGKDNDTCSEDKLGKMDHYLVCFFGFWGLTWSGILLL